MKTLKLNYSSIAFKVGFCATLLLRCPVVAQTVVSAATPANLQLEKTDVKSLVNTVKFDRNRINSLCAKYKADKAAGNKMAMLEDQKQLTRENGDLEMDKAYLKAEKNMFINSYDLAIHTQREALHRDRTRLAEAQVKLNNDLAAIDSKSDQDARSVVQCEQNLANDKLALQQKIVKRNNDVLALNKAIKKQNGEFVGSIYIEDAVASTQNLFEK